jgi:precorrin-8X/cobalt-precorrin-8 methylmutase
LNKLAISKEIEEESYKIIDSLLKELKLPLGELAVVKRVVHATTDLDYSKELIFHPQAISNGLKAIYEKKNIITDVNMVRVGISNYEGEIICLIKEESVLIRALKLNITKASSAMREAKDLMEGGIVVIGNAPTALFEVCRMVENKEVKPALIVGVPVGFVGALESKEKLKSLSIPYITNQGRKGGSSVAVAIVNALLKLSRGENNV